MSAMIRRSPLVAFFVLAYAFTWALWIPAAPFLQGLYRGEFPVAALLVAVIGAYGPTAAALVVTRAQGGKGGVKRLLSHFLVWRVGARWYALLVLTPLALTGCAVALNVLIGGQAPTGMDPSRWYMLPLVLLSGLPFGPLAEETGWRGFALPRLQARFGPLPASVLLGLAWGLWHLPAFFIPGVALAGGATGDPGLIAWYVLDTVAVTIFFTWVYNNTRGSLLVDVLFHAAINTMPAFLLSMVYLGLAGGEVVYRTVHLSAIVLIAATGGRLSYKGARPAVAAAPAAATAVA